MKKSWFTLLAVLVVLSMVLAACGATETPVAEPTEAPAGETPQAPEATTQPEATQPPAPGATLSIWHQWSGDYLTAIEDAINQCAAEQGVTVDMSKPEDTSNALSVAIPAGEGPDIIGWANDQIGTQALAGNIVALNDYGIDMTFLNTTYEPAAVRGVVWQDMIWGLPESQEGIAIVYNKALLTDEYLPTDPMDFADLLAKAQAFNEDTGKYLVCNQGLGNPDAYHVAPIYFGHGVPEYVDDQGMAYLNTPEALAAGEWMVQFSAVAPAETSHDICKAMITEGDAAAWWTGPWAIADLEAAGIDYGIIPMGKPFVGIKALMLSQNAVDRGNAEAAVELMKCFTSGPVQAQLAAANKTIPATTAALQASDVQALPTLKGFGASLNLGVPMANTPFANAQWGPVGDATTAIWTGAQAPEEALTAAQVTIETAIEEMGGPAAGTEAPVAKPTEAVLLEGDITIWHQWSGDYLTAIEQAFNDYVAEHPGVTIDMSKPEDTSNALSVAIPAGEGPDIIGWANDQIGTQALAGNIVALNDYGIDMTFLNTTYEPAAVRGVVWQDMIWGLPESQEGIAIVYNKALVTDEYLPTDPMDFADLLAKAQAFNEDTGKYLVCNQGLGNPDAYHVAPIYFGHGVPEYVDDEGNAYLNSPEALAAGEWMVDFSAVAPAETSHDICKAMITEGDAGAWWTGPWAIADLEAAGIDYGIIPMGSPFVGIKALMLSQNAVDRGNTELAIDIMKYFTSGPVQAKIAAANKTIPAATAALQASDVQALPTLKGFGASLNLGVPMANSPFANAQWGPVGDATTAIWTGAQAPEEALAAAQATIDEAIAAMR